MLKNLLQRSDIPLDICLLFLIIGSLLLWSKKFRLSSRLSILAGTFLVLISSLGVAPLLLIEPLENKFPSLLSPKDLGPVASEIQFVVVLGGEALPIKNWPLTSQMGTTMLTRLIEGIRLLNNLPQSRLVLSGGGRHEFTDAEIMKKLALELGVAPDRIILELQSTSTVEEVMFLKDLLGGKRFILVTSARHMPRAMSLFRHAGLDAIPAPTGHLVVPRNELEWRHFLPRSGNMNLVSHAFYEYLASFKVKLSGLNQKN